MNYKVRVIADNDLPAEVNWALVRDHGRLEFWLRASVATRAALLEVSLEEAWDAYRDIVAERLLSWPEPELPVAM